MCYTLGNKCAKNLCKWTVLVQLTIKNMETQCIYTVYIHKMNRVTSRTGSAMMTTP